MTDGKPVDAMTSVDAIVEHIDEACGLVRGYIVSHGGESYVGAGRSASFAESLLADILDECIAFGLSEYPETRRVSAESALTILRMREDLADVTADWPREVLLLANNVLEALDAAIEAMGLRPFESRRSGVAVGNP